MKLVLIKKDGTMDDINITNKKKIINPLTKICNSQGNNDLKLLYTWAYGKSEIHCYGWYDGEAGFENKHDLPPSGKTTFLDMDSSEQLLFGDIFILKMENGKYCNFEISDYGEFYNFSFGGFDDCESSDDNDNFDEDEQIDDDYIAKEDDEWDKTDDEDEDEDYENGEESELGEDCNTY